MSAPARVGVVGCEIIGKRYVEDAPAFDAFEIVACADLDAAAGEAFAAAHGLAAATVEELVADPTLDVVLNLTPPAAHATLIGAALAAGKHVYTEKPLAASFAAAAELVARAERLGLRLGCAPDTFLSPAYEAARELVAEGAIGEPLSAVAFVATGGPESWHGNADFFYRAGGGPLLDMGPYYLTAIVSLLGPFARVTGFASRPTAERELAVGSRAGERFAVEVPTHVTAALELPSGAHATLTTSFEARGRSVARLFVLGRDGALELPDPNAFDGPLCVRRVSGTWTDAPLRATGLRDTRGAGLQELLEALAAGRQHRASGALALHVLETATAIVDAAAERRVVELTTRP